MNVQRSEVVHTSILAPSQEVIAFLSDMNNWKTWAPWVRSVKRSSARDWTLDTDAGRMKIRFVESNSLGVLDHEVTLASGVTVLNSMRVLANGSGSELVMVLFQSPGTPTEAFERDIQAVRDDLARIKKVTETPKKEPAQRASRGTIAGSTMATRADVRRIALSFPATEREEDRFAFSVRNKGKLKGFAWVWMERVAPKKPRVPNPGVIAVRVPNLAHKDLMLSADPVTFFTEPHYNGFPAVLVRLHAVSVADLEVLLEDAWRCQAPADLVKRPKQKSAGKSPKPAEADAS